MSARYSTGDKIIFQAVKEGAMFMLNVSHPIKDKVYEITYVLSSWGLKEGYVAFGIKEVNR